MGTERKRIDIVLVERGLLPSRTAARAAVMAGLVYVNGTKVDKPGTPVGDDTDIEVRQLPRFVSRGGLKLEKALLEFGVNVSERVVLDVGASTGGFTDCLLQQGAVKVYSVDVGYGQLDWRLRQDERVVSMERTNIRHLTAEAFDVAPDFASVDVSFISLSLVLPVLTALGVREVVTLVKPQFEIGRGRVGKKGVVRDKSDHLEVLEKVAAAAKDAGFVVVNASFSPIQGPEGNIEFLMHLQAKDMTVAAKQRDFGAVVDRAHNQFNTKGIPACNDE